MTFPEPWPNAGPQLIAMLNDPYLTVAETEHLVEYQYNIHQSLLMQRPAQNLLQISEVDTARALLSLATKGPAYLQALLGVRSYTTYARSASASVFINLYDAAQIEEVALALVQSAAWNEFTASLLLLHPLLPEASESVIQQALAAQGLFAPVAMKLLNRRRGAYSGWFQSAHSLEEVVRTGLNPPRGAHPRLAHTAWLLAQTWTGEPESLLAVSAGILASV